MIDVTLENFEAGSHCRLHDPARAGRLLGPLVRALQGRSGPMLEKLEAEYAGRFKLVKIDSDQEQQLAGAFGIRSIPTCILLMNGQPVDGFMGALPEGQVRQFLDKHVPGAGSRSRGRRSCASRTCRSTPRASWTCCSRRWPPTRPTTTRASTTSRRCCWPAADDARTAFEPVIAKAPWCAARLAASAGSMRWTLPPARQAPPHRRVRREDRGQQARLRGPLRPRPRADRQQRWTDAMDELLEILMRDKAWNEDLARKTYIAILDVIEPPKPKVAEQIPPEIRRWRRTAGGCRATLTWFAAWPKTPRVPPQLQATPLSPASSCCPESPGQRRRQAVRRCPPALRGTWRRRWSSRPHVLRQARRRGRRRCAQGLPLMRHLLQPVAHELLVVAGRVLAGREGGFVALHRPVARRVGRQHLVHQHQRAVLVEAELELGVGNDHALGQREGGGLLVDARCSRRGSAPPGRGRPSPPPARS
jgi:putative thioredoxin